MPTFASHITGWLFIGAGAMLWLGWFLLPARPGAFFLPHDFGAIRARYRRWIWLFRLQIFGYVATVMAAGRPRSASAGLARRGRDVDGCARGRARRGLLLPRGAWGAMELEGTDEPEALAFIAAARVSTHYATCLVRFGRVFFGLGQLVLAAGLLRAGALPVWIGYGGVLLGLSAIAVTMAVPEPVGAVPADLPSERRLDAGDRNHGDHGGPGCRLEPACCWSGRDTSISRSSGASCSTGRPSWRRRSSRSSPTTSTPG